MLGAMISVSDNAADVTLRNQAEEVLVKAGALQSAIFNSANFSSIATGEKGVIQIFNVGAERMLGYTAAEVMNTITPADISDPQEVIARQGLERRDWDHDRTGLRGAGVQGLARVAQPGARPGRLLLDHAQDLGIRCFLHPLVGQRRAAG